MVFGPGSFSEAYLLTIILQNGRSVRGAVALVFRRPSGLGRHRAGEGQGNLHGEKNRVSAKAVEIKKSDGT